MRPMADPKTPEIPLLTPVLSDNWDAARSWTRASYERSGGYQALDTALGMDPAAVVPASPPA